MARIRTVKPEFYRHEKMQDLELNFPTLKPMLVFQALFGHCDKQGVFEWRPRILKLDILPFLPFEMEETLKILLQYEFLIQFESQRKIYGYIPTFQEHQRISGKEYQEPSKYPSPPEGSTREAIGKHTESQEGKGKEQEGNGYMSENFEKPQDLFNLWNKYASKSNLISARELSNDRKQKCKTRLNERPLTEWEKVFSKCASTPFLNGASNTKWKASFDWIIANSDNAIKVLEGKYDQQDNVDTTKSKETRVLDSRRAKGLSLCHGAKIEDFDGVKRCLECNCEAGGN